MLDFVEWEAGGLSDWHVLRLSVDCSVALKGSELVRKLPAVSQNCRAEADRVPMDQLTADVAHLFRRAGFGALQTEIEAYRSWPWPELVEMVLDVSRAPAIPALPDLSDESEGHLRVHRMIHYWLDLARRPVDQAPVIEKVTLFLSGLLTSSVAKTFDHQGLMEQNHLFRTLGMGDYRAVLQAVSVNTAMIRYLDNLHNVTGAPNENFARELMELFTLGLSNFSETDVVDGARAWTGHGLDRQRPRQYYFDGSKHDYGTKTFLGATGTFDGPDIIDLILDRRRDEHARFICQKLWSFFAYPVEIGAQVVTDVAATYSIGLNIRDTLRAIFLHPEFRSDRARWALVRSPIEYLVAVMRHTGTDCSVLHPEWWCGGMGQTPFRPPNVNGWGQNRYWLSSSAAWTRMQMATYLHRELLKRGDLSAVDDLSSNSPRQYRFSPDQSADMALRHYQLAPVSAASRQMLIDYVETVRATKQYWSERTGLLYLPLLFPEMQVA